MLLPPTLSRLVRERAADQDTARLATPVHIEVGPKQGSDEAPGRRWAGLTASAGPRAPHPPAWISAATAWTSSSTRRRLPLHSIPISSSL